MNWYVVDLVRLQGDRWPWLQTKDPPLAFLLGAGWLVETLDAAGPGRPAKILILYLGCVRCLFGKRRYDIWIELDNL